jgi:hypothetical protein
LINYLRQNHNDISWKFQTKRWSKSSSWFI